MKVQWSLWSTFITSLIIWIITSTTFEFYALKGVVVTTATTTYKVENDKLVVEVKTKTMYKHESTEPGCRSK